jgi:hypothetical protein
MIDWTGVWSKVRSFISWRDGQSDGGYVALVPEVHSPPLPRIRTARDWTAAACDPSEAFNIGAEAVRRFEKMPRMFEPVNEETTKAVLLTPMLETLGWEPLRCEVPLKGGGKVDYYVEALRTGIEVKAAKPVYDQIDARNPTPPYKTIGDQLDAYLRDDAINRLIYTNGRFWWRIERDPSKRLFALRFDLYTAQNLLKAHGQHEPLCHFGGFFQAAAFRPGANLTIPVHPGRRIDCGGALGAVMVKDINRGLGRSSLDE